MKFEPIWDFASTLQITHFFLITLNLNQAFNPTSPWTARGGSSMRNHSRRAALHASEQSRFALQRWLDVAVAKKQMGVWVLTVPPRSEIHRVSIHIVSNSTRVHTLIAQYTGVQRLAPNSTTKSRFIFCRSFKRRPMPWQQLRGH